MADGILDDIDTILSETDEVRLAQIPIGPDVPCEDDISITTSNERSIFVAEDSYTNHTNQTIYIDSTGYTFYYNSLGVRHAPMFSFKENVEVGVDSETLDYWGGSGDSWNTEPEEPSEDVPEDEPEDRARSLAEQFIENDAVILRGAVERIQVTASRYAELLREEAASITAEFGIGINNA
jgi:hypothetical protein